MSDGRGDIRVEAEGELALGRIALDDGDIRHAATHFGNALAQDPSMPDAYSGLHELDRATGDALALYPLDGNLYIGTVAARSYLLARAGQFDEALDLLARVVAHQPEKPWAAAGWLETPDLATRLDPDRAATSLVSMAVALSDPVPDALAPGLQPFLELSRGIVATHPTKVHLLPALSGVARRLRAVDEAVAWCEHADRVAPSEMGAIMLGYALRSAGRHTEMEQAWRRALQYNPNNVDVHVDLAESAASRGRLDDGLAWLDRALALDPSHRKALPSACEMRFQRDGDVAHLVRLADHWRMNPDHTYSDDMLTKASDDRMWLRIIPAPSEAITNVALQVAEQNPDPQQRREISGTISLSALEPPSAMAAVQAMLPGLVVEVTKVPEPDLRTPLAQVRHRLWTYQGTTAVPAVRPPSAEAAETLRTVAEQGWAHPVAAYDHAVRLSGLGLEDLLGLLVHVPPPPAHIPVWQRMAQTDPVYWARFSQAWTCLGILHHRADEPWPTSTRRAVLLDLATGVEDWTTDSALNAMVVAAWVDPAVRADVANLVGHRFVDGLKAYRRREVTIIRSLASLVLITPEMNKDAIELARDLLRREDGK